jgi:hypothetical protein
MTVPVQGLTIFATFFVAASAIERLLEPVASLLPSSQDAKSDASTKAAAAGHDILTTGSTNSLQDAATAADGANWLIYLKMVAMWTLATVIAMIASAMLRLYFLRTVGIAGGGRGIEISPLD